MQYTTATKTKQVQPTMLANPHVQQFTAHPIGRIVTWVALKMYTLIGLGFSLLPLVLLSYTRWLPVYHACGYVGIVFFGPWTTWAVKKVFRVARVKAN